MYATKSAPFLLTTLISVYNTHVLQEGNILVVRSCKLEQYWLQVQQLPHSTLKAREAQT